MLDDVKFEALPTIPEADREPGIPYATHRGVLKIGDVEIECVVLSDGQRLLVGDAIEKLVEGLRTLGRDEV